MRWALIWICANLDCLSPHFQAMEQQTISIAKAGIT